MQALLQRGELGMAYWVYGSGEQVVLAFHGFGRSPGDFEVFLPLLEPGQRLVAISLFAHGESRFPDSRMLRDPLHPEEWRSLFLALLGDLGVDSCDLVGYSMGGRVAMMTLLLEPSRIRSMLLLAPDGLKINRLYSFVSGTRIGQRLYEWFIYHPEFFFALVRGLNKVGILNDKLHRFLHVHLDSMPKRELVRDAWMIYREMFPDLDKLAKTIRDFEVPVHMLFGRFDSVIRVELGERFVKRLGEDGVRSLHVLDIGHRMLELRTLSYIRENALWPPCA